MYYKIVRTDTGLSVAHLSIEGLDAEIISPGDGKVRADQFITQYIENNEPMGWGPVEERTIYRIGEVTQADKLDRDTDVMSGAGLHAFENREDALSWMEHADV